MCGTHDSRSTTSVLETICPRKSPAVVQSEHRWRVYPQQSISASSPASVAASRWQSLTEQEREENTENPTGCHVIGILLRKMNVNLSLSGRPVLNGFAAPGTILVTEPGVAACCAFRGPYDELHLHMPNDLIAECVDDLPGREYLALRSEVIVARDPLIEQLGHALSGLEGSGSSFGQLYIDCIGVALVTRLLARPKTAACIGRRRVTPLARWRLKRAVDYIEDHLDRPLSLADIASSAGITRMYFAAQFRAATGLRPHEYLLRRRIERAQKLLIQTPAPLVEVALAVGFQTQSHFTTVFTRYTRQTPSVWRMLHCGTKRRFEEGSALDLPPPSHARGSEAVSVNTAWLCS